MSLYEICERCGSREHQWRVREYEIRIGEVHRRPHLCDDCACTVMSAVMVALRPVPRERQGADQPQP